MATKQYETAFEVGRIRETLKLRDPEARTILVGSAAVLACFYNLDLEAPVGCEDVDVLCPQGFFDEALASVARTKEASKVQVRWPKGRLRERGATNLSLDIYPSEDSDALPFTAAVDMSDLFLPTSYEDASKIAETGSGLKYVPLPYILRWLAIIGREKDIEAVNTILPHAIAADMMSVKQEEEIRHEVDKTLRDRLHHPERYYPRVV